MAAARANAEAGAGLRPVEALHDQACGRSGAGRFGGRVGWGMEVRVRGVARGAGLTRWGGDAAAEGWGRDASGEGDAHAR